MRVVRITPGTGDSFYCENCVRDAALVMAMRTLGHDVLMIPMYLPVAGDTEETVAGAPSRAEKQCLKNSMLSKLLKKWCVYMKESLDSLYQGHYA